MSKRVPQLLVALVALFGLIAVVAAVRPDHGNKKPAANTIISAAPVTAVAQLSQSAKANRAARTFLDRYVGPDGRVHREPDGDTVSEGQAYAMLLTVAVDDHKRFDLVWNWTRTNMLNGTGSLAWHWVNGAIVDGNAATDADVDASRALLAAADKFSVPVYRSDGLSLANALFRNDVIQTGSGPVLVAGPWATKSPLVVNPSYISPVAFDSIAAVSGDARWTSLRMSGIALLAQVTDNGTTLPPDWASVPTTGSARAAAAPNGDAVSYGYDAFRTLPRLAESCDAESRTLAAALWKPAQRTLDQPAATSKLDGTVLTAGDNPLFLVAAASAADAAGDTRRANELLDRAEQFNGQSPSYYLSAWVAIARLQVDTDLLGGCSHDLPARPSTTRTTAEPASAISTAVTSPIPTTGDQS
jgi:endo-1,4-beta-D-glucanase Y